MINLNELAVIAYENAEKREAKDGKVSTDTMKMLKHTALYCKPVFQYPC